MPAEAPPCSTRAALAGARRPWPRVLEQARVLLGGDRLGLVPDGLVRIVGVVALAHPGREEPRAVPVVAAERDDPHGLIEVELGDRRLLLRAAQWSQNSSRVLKPSARASSKLIAPSVSMRTSVTMKWSVASLPAAGWAA